MALTVNERLLLAVSSRWLICKLVHIWGRSNEKISCSSLTAE